MKHSLKKIEKKIHRSQKTLKELSNIFTTLLEECVKKNGGIDEVRPPTWEESDLLYITCVIDDQFEINEKLLKEIRAYFTNYPKK